MSADGLWILVMNASRAQILRGMTGSVGGRPRSLVMRAKQVNMAALLGAPELSLSPQTGSRGKGRPEWLAAVETDQTSFRKRVIDLLETHRVAGDFGRLVIFASPKVMQSLRSAMPYHLRTLVVAEVEENVIDLSFFAMRHRIAARLRERGITDMPGK